MARLRQLSATDHGLVSVVISPGFTFVIVIALVGIVQALPALFGIGDLEALLALIRLPRCVKLLRAASGKKQGA